ncbi:ABC transporter permease [Paenalcaligenes niemegkensis]|uniref:ABC transporter permease n=1 Tax=Paenalcaligenes niemegkensis TaxID=2895469 RepID=UPI001EE95248|nr:ABC transporter permease [Paenalcaligenes niemegkensis]MCQ9615684.1 ABC transporter permease [Paenalcaligenes niemegkensis]
MPKFAVLWTDVFIWLAVLGGIFYVWHVSRNTALKNAWSSVWRTPSAAAAGVILGAFLVVGLLDSIHYRPQLPPLNGNEQSEPRYAPISRSVLDDVLVGTGLAKVERTYSSPLALHLFFKESQIIDGQAVRDFPPLEHAASGIENTEQRSADITRLVGYTLLAVVVWTALSVGLLNVLALRRLKAQGTAVGWSTVRRHWWARDSELYAWKAAWFAATALVACGSIIFALSGNYYVLGTDRSGNDVIALSLKSVRTALVIGTLTTFAMLPPALGFGIAAGYFKGWVDDIIQYIYTTLTSIPGVLLIAACVLMMQVYIDNHPNLFETVAARADLRLFLLCLILGFTGWSGLCRLLRAETLKLRELEYVQAAKAFGVSHFRIMLKHILPNLMHIVLITMVLEFSGLVLYEAVLSYLGIGVDPSMPSFGTMIDAARIEMSRDPMIWWNLSAAFVFLLALVLSANIFADAVQRAFDPRVRRLHILVPRLKTTKLVAKTTKGESL